MRRFAISSLLALSVMQLPVQADEMFNRGRQWLSLSPGAREWWVEGFRDGRTYVVFEASSIFPRTTPEAATYFSTLANRTKIETTIDSASIAGVMTDLYKDPANTFIQHRPMLYIAQQKLLGEKIEDQLIFERKSTVEFHKLQEKYKQLK